MSTTTAPPAPIDPVGVYTISETDFWSHLHVPKGTPADAAAALIDAIRLGLDGSKEAAYLRLAEFHKLARAREWGWLRDEAKKQKPMTPAQLRKLTPSKAMATLETTHDFLAELRNPSYELVRSGNAAARRYLIRNIDAFYADRYRQTKTYGYPIGSQLGCFDQVTSLWRFYMALIHTGPAPVEQCEALLKLTMAIGRKLEPELRRYIVHNIFTAACYGLFRMARTMTEFTQADGWEEMALANLDTDWDRSFFPDGGHAERNWGYGSHTLHRHTDNYEFAMRTGGLHRREKHYLEGLQRAYRLYAYTLGPKDRYPGFGDEGLGFGGHILDQRERVFPPGTPRDMGVDRTKSYLMQGVGVAVMRNGARDDSAFANVSFGDFAGWHSHQDLLSMNFWSLGETLLEKPPRYGPYEGPLDIGWRSPENQNQLLVDHFFYDCRAILGEEVHWHSDERLDYFSAIHRAYRSVAPQEGWRTYHGGADMVVRRTIVFVKNPGYLLVLDSVKPEEGDSFNRATSVYWHSPGKFRILRPGLATTTVNKSSCVLAWARPQSIKRFEAGVDYYASDFDKTSGYRHDPVDWYSLRARTWRNPAGPGVPGFAAALVPYQGKGLAPAVVVKPLTLQGGVEWRAEAFEVTTPAGRDIFVLNPEKRAGVTFRGGACDARLRALLGKARGETIVD